MKQVYVMILNGSLTVKRVIAFWGQNGSKLKLSVLLSCMICLVPENIHTIPMDGCWKLQGVR